MSQGFVKTSVRPDKLNKAILQFTLLRHLANAFVQSDLAVDAIQGADQHIRSSLGFSILPKDISTCRPGESNQGPSDSKTLVLPLFFVFLVLFSVVFRHFKTCPNLLLLKVWCYSIFFFLARIFCEKLTIDTSYSYILQSNKSKHYFCSQNLLNRFPLLFSETYNNTSISHTIALCDAFCIPMNRNQEVILGQSPIYRPVASNTKIHNWKWSWINVLFKVVFAFSRRLLTYFFSPINLYIFSLN